MKLEWSVFAIEDRDRIFDYIELDNPQAAASNDQRIAARVAKLARFPESGRPGRVVGTREMPVTRTPYIVVYRISGNIIRILRVLHGAQMWPVE